MASTTFYDRVTPIYASWLNDVDRTTYRATSNISGAIVRAALDKFTDTVSVKDFGAVGDGVADDTSAIQAAINSFNGSITGGCIHLPAGIYKISSTLNFGSKPNMKLMGDGTNVSVIKPTTAVNVAVSFGLPSGAAHCTITDLHISCVDATSCIGVEVFGIQVFNLDRVAITNPSVGISITNGIIQYYNNFYIENTKIAGIKLDGGNDHFFHNGVVTNGANPQPSMAGFWCTKSDAFWMTNCDFISQNNGMLLNPQGTDYISWVFISNSAFDSGNGDGIKCDPAVGALIKGVNLEGSWTASNQGFGINISGLGTVDAFRVNGHRSYRNVKSGYYIDNFGTRKNIAFVSSEAAGNSWTNAGVYSGFDIAANVSGFSILGCRSGAIAAQANTQLRGILVNPGTSNNYDISHNDVRDNTIGILDGGTGTNKVIKGNIGYISSSSGTSSIATSGTSVVVNHGLSGTPLPQDIAITATSAMGSNPFYLDTTSITSTQFTVRTASAVGGQSFFTWQAKLVGA